MGSKRANGEGTVRKRTDGRWEGFITVGHKENGKPIMKSVFAKTLEKASEYAVNEKMTKALDELREIYKIVGDKRIVLDFSNINDDGYYNGIIFKGYINNVPKVVLSGGRYDKLMEKLDKKAEAIGFAVYLGEIEKYIKDDIRFDADILLTYTDDDSAQDVFKKAAELRSSGKSVRVQKPV